MKPANQNTHTVRMSVTGDRMPTCFPVTATDWSSSVTMKTGEEDGTDLCCIVFTHFYSAWAWTWACPQHEPHEPHEQHGLMSSQHEPFRSAPDHSNWHCVGVYRLKRYRELQVKDSGGCRIGRKNPEGSGKEFLYTCTCEILFGTESLKDDGGPRGVLANMPERRL